MQDVQVPRILQRLIQGITDHIKQRHIIFHPRRDHPHRIGKCTDVKSILLTDQRHHTIRRLILIYERILIFQISYLVIRRDCHNIAAVTFHAKNESIEHFFSICILEPNRITISNVDSSVHKAEFEHSGADLPLRRNLHFFFHRRHIRRAIMLYQ